MQEFILRDGEIAFNMPNGTVTIMNVNTYLQLQKALKEQEEKEEGPSFFELAVGLLLAGAAADSEDPSDPEPENKKVLTDEAFKKWARLPENKNKTTNQTIEEEPKTFKVSGVVPNFVLDGKPYSRGQYTIIASDGRIFRSGAEAEGFYDLPEGSVSSFFNGRQKYLRVGRWNAAKMPINSKIGLVRTRADRFAVDTAKEYTDDWIAQKMEKNYALYRTLCREAAQTME